MSFPKIKYTGTTPGADSDTYNFLNTITAGYPGHWAAVFGVYKVMLDIDHSHAGTVKVYKSHDDVPTQTPVWSQTYELAVAAPAAASASSQIEVFVEAHKHTKIDWVNGGTAQDPWLVDISFSKQRAQL